MNTKHILITTLLLFSALLVGCSTDETDIGVNLQDSSTLYHGIRDTISPDIAMSVRDTALRTSGYQMGVIGNYADATFGSVQSVVYTQVALPNSTGITFDDNTTIDSVVLSLVTSAFYPAKAEGYNLHFEVKQLAEQLYTDTIYYSNSTLAVDNSTAFYNQRKHYNVTDSVINLRMDASFHELLRGTQTVDEFLAHIKGLRVRIVGEHSDPCMVSLNWAASGTIMTVHYHYNDTPDEPLTYQLKVGAANHFTNFIHDYSATALGADSIDGTTRLYLEPMGGYNIKLRFDSALKAFAAAHPYATIHYAELLLPTTAEADTNRPAAVTLLRYLTDSTFYPVADNLDGTYDASRHCYRLRLSIHLQSLLRDGTDRGMLINLDTRRHDARRTIIGGPAASNPVRIEFIYTE